MKKSELKTGMIVETREGKEYVVFIDVCKTRYVSENYNGNDSVLVNNNIWLSLDDYEDNMLHSGKNNSFDIIKVYIPNHPYSFIDTSYEKSQRNLIWKRIEEAKEMTMEELEKHFGCKIKIVKD